jgi:hypothetical protein
MMNHSTRRSFLQKSALVTLGALATSSGIALGDTPAESQVRSMDAELADVLRTYGRTGQVKEGGFQKVRAGSRSRRLPVSRLKVEVRDQDSFRRSFEQLTELSDRVMVEGNTTHFARGHRYFVIENRVA